MARPEIKRRDLESLLDRAFTFECLTYSPFYHLDACPVTVGEVSVIGNERWAVMEVDNSSFYSARVKFAKARFNRESDSFTGETREVPGDGVELLSGLEKHGLFSRIDLFYFSVKQVICMLNPANSGESDSMETPYPVDSVLRCVNSFTLEKFLSIAKNEGLSSPDMFPLNVSHRKSRRGTEYLINGKGYVSIMELEGASFGNIYLDKLLRHQVGVARPLYAGLEKHAAQQSLLHLPHIGLAVPSLGVMNISNGNPRKRIRTAREIDLEREVSRKAKLAGGIAIDALVAGATALQLVVPPAGYIATVVLGAGAVAFIESAYKDHVMAGLTAADKLVPVISAFPACTAAYFRRYHQERLPGFLKIGAKRHSQIGYRGDIPPGMPFRF
ncbi:hypothetical protein HYY72_02615 [Candidatus Woesearchaeota archaeon]|nr:hypothetical protein [Candidatus Woesearchaeota archaeon]